VGVTYDAGALTAADRGERRMWARHQALLTSRIVPTVPAPVIAQTWRSDGRRTLLSFLLGGCEVESFDDNQARQVGLLVAKAATKNIVDATVVEGALRRNDIVISSNRSDLEEIASAAGRLLDIEDP
jgi:hypothetical protein